MTYPSLLAGRYRLLERRDNTGTTWRARDELLGREVTIAEVRLPPPGPHRDRLLGRVRAAADLRHPGVATLHDVISIQDHMWLVMEAVEGRSLIQTVRADGPLAPERAAEVGLRVLDALNAARERGVPLAATPDSVMLATDGRIVLTGLLVSAPVDDLRDLGTTLFTAVEGRVPDTGAQAVPRMADGSPLAAPTAVSVTGGPTGSGPLAPLVEGLLAADPAYRPDAASVRLALEEIAPRPATSRGRPLLAAAAAAAVIVAVAAALWLRPAAEPAGATAPVPLPTFFAHAPAACSLLSNRQVGELLLAAHPSEEKDNRCAWNTDDPNSPSSLKYRLWVQVLRYGSAERAHSDYTRFMEQEKHQTKTEVGIPLTLVKPPRALAGIASEAYVFGVTNQLTYNTGVVFRAANLVVVVQYQRGGADDSGGDTREGALRATRWVLEALSRTDRTGRTGGQAS